MKVNGHDLKVGTCWTNEFFIFRIDSKLYNRGSNNDAVGVRTGKSIRAIDISSFCAGYFSNMYVSMLKDLKPISKDQFNMLWSIAK